MATLFSEIVFDKVSHTYRLDGRRLPSVTSLVNRLKPPFDADYWAQRKADERGVEKAAILAEWEAKRQAGFERGTRVHEYIAGVLQGDQLVDDPFLGLNARLPEMAAFDELWKQLCREMKVRAIKAEWIVGDGEMGFAGTLDALLYSETTNQFHIFDWKTGDKFRVANGFQTLLSPFGDLDDCELVAYSLQMSFYRLAVERNAGLVLGDSYLVHLDGAGEFHIHGALDLRERAEAWLRGSCHE